MTARGTTLAQALDRAYAACEMIDFEGQKIIAETLAGRDWQNNNDGRPGIIMGSDSDAPVMAETTKVLQQFGVPCEIGVYSAHRSPHRTLEYVSSAEPWFAGDYCWRRKFRASGGC